MSSASTCQGQGHPRGRHGALGQLLPCPGQSPCPPPPRPCAKSKFLVQAVPCSGRLAFTERAETVRRASPVPSTQNRRGGRQEGAELGFKGPEDDRVTVSAGRMEPDKGFTSRLGDTRSTCEQYGEAALPRKWVRG